MFIEGQSGLIRRHWFGSIPEGCDYQDGCRDMTATNSAWITPQLTIDFKDRSDVCQLPPGPFTRRTTYRAPMRRRDGVRHRCIDGGAGVDGCSKREFFEVLGRDPTWRLAVQGRCRLGFKLARLARR